ncbi:unnamed protein product [Didymodactylos carnosus]|nr:unnamed protein product [Didymodactylos carnosus]CAF4403844.1 unnamed protein product [Didymodactylos carnosus]
MSGNIALNIPYLFLQDDWEVIYNEPYNHLTTTEELRSLLSKCSKQIIVAAHFKQQAREFSLAACGPKEILNLNTNQNIPTKFGNVYWYLTPKLSFGFSPTEKIEQRIIDTEDEQGTKRLSWHLNGFSGGYRVGMTKGLTENKNWRKVILTNTSKP